jgi:hypothetical protein
MTPAQKRAYLSKQYGPTWAGRVEKMTDAQVSAVYTRMINKERNR